MLSSDDLTRVYDAHAQALFGFLLNFTRDEAATKDLLQEIFVKLARDPGTLHGVRDERAFLIRLAHRLAIDAARRRGARQRASQRLAEESARIFAPAADPDAAALGRALHSAMAELPSDQRAVVHLKLWEGLTFEAIAAALEIPLNTAASRYRYALDKLRAQLRPLYEETR